VEILGFSLADPGFGLRWIAAELARERWGGLKLSPQDVWRVLRGTASTPAAGAFRSSPTTPPL
jgi:hypothetical protein